jgi:hypothetical protein
MYGDIMPITRISPKKLPVGTVLREGRPEAPIYYVVASVERVSERAFPAFPQKWKMRLRGATDDEKMVAGVMLT